MYVRVLLTVWLAICGCVVHANHRMMLQPESRLTRVHTSCGSNDHTMLIMSWACCHLGEGHIIVCVLCRAMLRSVQQQGLEIWLSLRQDHPPLPHTEGSLSKKINLTQTCSNPRQKYGRVIFVINLKNRVVHAYTHPMGVVIAATTGTAVADGAFALPQS